MTRRTWGSASLDPKRGTWTIRWQDAGKRRMERGYADEGAAYERLDDIQAALLAGQPVPPIGGLLVCEWVERYLKRAAPLVAETTLRCARSTLTLLAESDLGAMALPEITRQVAQGYVLERLAEVKPSTMHTQRAQISACWRTAIEQGLASENPWLRVRLPRAVSKTFPYLSQGDVDRVIQSIEPRFRALTTLLFETGLRRGELEQIAWDDVAPDFSRLTVRRSKSGKPRDVPLLMARAQAAIKELGESRQPGLVAPDVFRARTTYNMAWRAALKAAKVPYCSPHATRHWRAYSLVAAGVPLNVVAAWLGHANATLVAERYGRWMPEDALTRAVAVLAAAEAKTLDR